ncbi:MAG: DUF2612 domain-containing protein [Methylocystis sp.]|uniref:DUF2612 domain-containing protein n=1 Tax=Methylocystis sp. TaxID=1911079 RepID=UPI003DA1EA9E
MRIQALDFSINLLQAILWQYNDALRLQSLLESKQDWYNEQYSEFWDDWVSDVFDLRTANDFGLSVWAVILNIPLTITSGQEPSANLWGFGPFRKNFNRGNFAPSTSGIRLSTEQRRLVLRLRYFQLVTRGAIPEINTFLKYVFEDLGDVYVLDGLDMTMDYVFTFALPSQLRFVLESYDILPRPAGVGVNYTILVRDTFGFGPFHRNFNRGTFGSN